MNNFKIYNMDKERMNMNLIFSFFCKENNKTYVALENADSIFEDNSSYANIDVLELIKSAKNTIYVSKIPDDEWLLVKQTIQHKVFSKIGK